MTTPSEALLKSWSLTDKASLQYTEPSRAKLPRSSFFCINAHHGQALGLALRPYFGNTLKLCITIWILSHRYILLMLAFAKTVCFSN